MLTTDHLWAILLAAGDGVRVRSHTIDRQGQSVPKQYFAHDGCHSMLRWAVNRAAQRVSKRQIVAVVARQHQRWWDKELPDLAPENILVQPRNKGTAAGLLFPLLDILYRDPQAKILVLPSDHHVDDEARLSLVIGDAIQAIEDTPEKVVLVGMTPEDPDTDYGWIVPDGPPKSAIRQVAAFVEKPDRATAQAIMDQGGLLNSLILVAAGRTLLHLYDLAAPDLVGSFISWPGWAQDRVSGLDELYTRLPTYDFSKQLLERSVEALAVIESSTCGWSDLGTPKRLQRYRLGSAADRIRATA